MRGREVENIDEVERSGIEKVMVDSETCDMR
jgi:hypothetical protein